MSGIQCLKCGTIVVPPVDAAVKQIACPTCSMTIILPGVPAVEPPVNYLLIRYGPGTRGTWMVSRSYVAMLYCVGCGRPTALRDYKILPDGRVWPWFVCRHTGCVEEHPAVLYEWRGGLYDGTRSR